MKTRNCLSSLLLALGLAGFAAVPARAGLAIAPAAGLSLAGGGSTFVPSLFAFSRFDGQTLIGLHGGLQDDAYFTYGALYVRLPFGRVLQPVFLGEAGLASLTAPAFGWRAGGGLDWKNGERTSILLLGGAEDNGGGRNWYARTGLLLEF